MAELIFFASIREEIGCDRLSLELSGEPTISEVISSLGDARGENWQSALSAENVRIAVNQELISGDPNVSNDDEIAFFPPVTGG